MRPPSPVPLSQAKLYPFSFAKARAKGEALIESSVILACVVSEVVDLTSADLVASGAFTATGAGADACTTSGPGAGAADSAAKIGLKSVPGSPTIAIIPSTIIPWPSFAPIYNNVPSCSFQVPSLLCLFQLQQ